MPHRQFYGFIAVLLWSASASGADFWLTDLNEAREQADRLNRPILCHFGATWCAPCQQMERNVLKQQQVLKQLEASVIGLKIDADRHPELMKRFGIERFPTDVIIEPTGARIVQSTGVHTQDQYLAMVNRACSRYADLLAQRDAAKSTPIPDSTEAGEPDTTVVKSGTTQLTLEGYCPVTLWENRRWIQGEDQYQVEYQGQRVLLSSKEAFDKFNTNPKRYLPRFLGCDPVVVWETDRTVPGKIDFAAFYDDELFLFSSNENRAKFKSSPDQYTRTRVVLRPEDGADSQIR